jgi:ABC-type multidrug transport system ATPase subunit
MCNAIGIMNHGKLIAAGKMEDILNRGIDFSKLIISVRSDMEQAVKLIQESPGITVESVKENAFSSSNIRKINIPKTIEDAEYVRYIPNAIPTKNEDAIIAVIVINILYCKYTKKIWDNQINYPIFNNI